MAVPKDRHHALKRYNWSLRWEDEDPVGNQHDDQACRQSEIRQHARLALTHIAFLQAQIRQCCGRETPAILSIVAEGEDRQDEGCENEADPQSVGIAPYFCTGAEEQSVHESQYGVEADQPGRRLPRPFDVT